MKPLYYILLTVLFALTVGLGYIDYKHFSRNYRLELKIQKINAENTAMLNKINTFCLGFSNKKGVIKK